MFKSEYLRKTDEHETYIFIITIVRFRHIQLRLGYVPCYTGQGALQAIRKSSTVRTGNINCVSVDIIFSEIGKINMLTVQLFRCELFHLFFSSFN